MQLPGLAREVVEGGGAGRRLPRGGVVGGMVPEAEPSGDVVNDDISDASDNDMGADGPTMYQMYPTQEIQPVQQMYPVQRRGYSGGYSGS